MLLVAPVALFGCATPLPPPAMAPAGASQRAAPEATRVVFVRPDSPCDAGDYSTIVDASGRFVANLSPGARVAAPTTPGTHVFYAWSSIDLRFEGQAQGFNPVAAVRVDAVPGTTSYVAILVTERGSTVTRCDPYPLADLVAVTVGGPRWSDLEGWLSSTKALVAEPGPGQLWLDSNPAKRDSAMDLGRARLTELDVVRTAEARINEERAAGSFNP